MSRALAACGVLLAAGFGMAAGAPLEVPFFRQAKNGCGAASVAMVAHYWSRHGAKEPAATPSPQRIYAHLYDSERRGIPLADMRRYLAQLGYRAFTFRGQWQDLERHLSKGRPVIVGLRKGPSKDLHFVVLTGTDGKRVWLNDPTRSRPQRMKRAAFEKRWTLAERWMLLATP